MSAIKQFLRPQQAKPPTALSAEAKILWESLAAEFAIVDAAGVLLLTVACEALDRLRQAQQILSEQGPLISDKTGGVKAHPMLAAERDSRMGLLSALRHLHLDIEPLKAIGRPPRG